MRPDIDFEYLSKIRTTFSLHTTRKTSNILEGDFRSVYRGRSMEFDELSEYMTGDDVHDIDWKSSSRADKVLVRRYVAERKHYVLFLIDAGKKMDADTSAGHSKAYLATMTLGVGAFLADRAGADISLLYGDGERIEPDIFRSGMPHLEKLISTCDAHITGETDKDVTALLNYATERIRKRMILFLVTDFDGLMKLDESLLNRVCARNDLMVVNIDDAYLMDKRAFDTDYRRYADTGIVQTKALARAERESRREILRRASYLFQRTRTPFTTITREEEIADRVIALYQQR